MKDRSKITNWEEDPELTFGKHSGKRMSTMPDSYLKWLIKENVTECITVNAEDILESRKMKGSVMKVTPLEGPIEDRRCYLIADSRQELEAFLQSTGICGQYYFPEDPDKGRISISVHDKATAITFGAIECKWTDMGDGKDQIAKTKTNTEGNKMVTPINDDSRLDISDMPGADMPSPKYIAFDTETELISYTNPVPDMMCITYADAGALHGSLTTPWETPVTGLVKSWWDLGYHTIGHNMPFDLSILMWNTPDLRFDIFNALDKGLIHDTLIREKLLNITMHGSIEFVEVNGITRRCGYALADLELKYLNIDRSDLKKNPDAPRNNYNIYRGVPAAQWAEPFIKYAVDDAVNTGLVFMKQEEERARCIRETGIDPFATEYYKMKSAWALRLLECTGTRQDPEMIIKVTEEFKAEYMSDRLTQPLDASGFRTPPVPPRPYAKGTLEHTEACYALKDDDQKAKRKSKTCGCPVKMKAGDTEHSPKMPRHQYIWNLAGINPDIEAWPAPTCASALRKAKAYKTVIEGNAFKREIILSCGIQNKIYETQQSIAALEKTITGYNNLDEPTPKKIKKDLKDLREKEAYILTLIAKGQQYFLPEDIVLTTKEEWAETFTPLDPLLEIWYEREKLKKIVNEYLPKMWYEDEDGNRSPATMLRAAYGPLVLTGRSHSWASKMYPSRSDQTVDPRVRPCTIPHIDGQVIVSTDINGMELGTLAQTCLDLFGVSELANKINAGIDTHAFLAAQIAFKLDVTFRNILINAPRPEGDVRGTGVQNKDEIYEGFAQLKEVGIACTSLEFCEIFKKDYIKKNRKELDREVVWKDFFKYYRTMAKPVGLGYPGMLGAATLSSLAKASYGVVMDKAMAEDLKEIWLETYPEMGLYLDHIKKHSIDSHHIPIMEEDDDGKTKRRVFYCYNTPRGMHRAKCGICEAANGTALQAPSAEGALDGLYEVQKACWLALANSPMSQAMPTMFIHDEIVWESPNDELLSLRAATIEKIMVDCMELITPGVKAGAESAAMYRWNKKAETVKDESGNLVAWVPDPEKGEK